MLHRSLRFAATALAIVCCDSALGQAAPVQSFVVCGSQPNEPTVYFSGVMVGPATAFNGFRTGFSDYLTQQHAYKGAVGCVPSRDAVQAQKLLTDRSTALRNAKKVVVDTGWTESAAAATPAPVLPVAQNKAASPAVASPVAATAAVAAKPAAAGAVPAGGSSASNASTFASTLGTIFGTGGAGAAGASSGAAGAAGKSGTGGATAAAGGAGGQSPFQQVSSTLTSVFGNKSSSGATSADAGSKSAAPASADSGLGSAQSGTTKLVVDGCGRQDTRVACVTELTNQNQKDTLVQASDVWADAFIVDDRGDRHVRTSAFFLNVDGDQRPQLDISYGKTARFILMFDDVPTKVQKVTLRSGSGLDVEDMSLIAPSTQAGAHH